MPCHSMLCGTKPIAIAERRFFVTINAFFVEPRCPQSWLFRCVIKLEHLKQAWRGGPIVITFQPTHLSHEESTSQWWRDRLRCGLSWCRNRETDWDPNGAGISTTPLRLTFLSIKLLYLPIHQNSAYFADPSYFMHLILIFSIRSLYIFNHQPHVSSHPSNSVYQALTFLTHHSLYTCLWLSKYPPIHHLTPTFSTPRTLCIYPYQSITLHMHIHQISYTCPFIKI